MAELAVAALAIAMCDQDGCDEPARVSYRWEWGATGQCCQKHALLLQQTAGNLSRQISLTPLAASAPLPLTRDERTKLIAEKLSAEAETEEVKGRNAEMYRQNAELTRQVQSLTVFKREADAQLKDNAIELRELRAKLEEREADLATATDELQRLQVLAAYTPSEDTQPQGSTIG